MISIDIQTPYTGLCKINCYCFMHLNTLLRCNNYRKHINETKLFCSDDNAVMLEYIVCEHNTRTVCALIHNYSSFFFLFFPLCFSLDHAGPCRISDLNIREMCPMLLTVNLNFILSAVTLFPEY